MWSQKLINICLVQVVKKLIDLFPLPPTTRRYLKNENILKALECFSCFETLTDGIISIVVRGQPLVNLYNIFDNVTMFEHCTLNGA